MVSDMGKSCIFVTCRTHWVRDVQMSHRVREIEMSHSVRDMGIHACSKNVDFVGMHVRVMHHSKE